MSKVNSKTLEVWYLFHSGFAVKVQDKLLIFDYYCDKPEGSLSGLAAGVVRADDLKDIEVFVFSSHKHADHYNPVVLEWEKLAKKITYIFSDDIMLEIPIKNAIHVSPNMEYDINSINITTYNSTDIGTAFLVKVYGYVIFHAGDLNWWHWEGEPDNDNIIMGQKYKAEIDKLKGIKIDIAFIPVDPRLEDQYILGIDYFMSEIGANAIFPMHFADNHSVFGRLMHDQRTEAYRNNIKVITERGQHFTF